MNTTEQEHSTGRSLMAQKLSHCFRGVHDDIISDEEIDNALRLGNNLILDGGDHFTIHYNVSHLERKIPTTMEKIQALLQETYHVNQDAVEPVAFRVYTVGPMDAHGVNLYRSPAWTLNRTVSTNNHTVHDAVAAFTDTFSLLQCHSPALFLPELHGLGQ